MPAKWDHIHYIAEHMSEADRNEVAAAVGIPPSDALYDSWVASVVCWTGMVDERPVCMFGVSAVDILGGVGAPWLLGTDDLPRHAKTFLRLNREYIPKMLDVFPALINWVDVRHVVAIRWLRRLGFEFDAQPVVYGPWGMEFYRFTMEKNKCA